MDGNEETSEFHVNISRSAVAFVLRRSTEDWVEKGLRLKHFYKFSFFLLAFFIEVTWEGFFCQLRFSSLRFSFFKRDFFLITVGKFNFHGILQTFYSEFFIVICKSLGLLRGCLQKKVTFMRFDVENFNSRINILKFIRNLNYLKKKNLYGVKIRI